MGDGRRDVVEEVKARTTALTQNKLKGMEQDNPRRMEPIELKVDGKTVQIKEPEIQLLMRANIDNTAMENPAGADARARENPIAQGAAKKTGEAMQRVIDSSDPKQAMKDEITRAIIENDVRKALKQEAPKVLQLTDGNVAKFDKDTKIVPAAKEKAAEAAALVNELPAEIKKAMGKELAIKTIVKLAENPSDKGFKALKEQAEAIKDDPEKIKEAIDALKGVLKDGGKEKEKPTSKLDGFGMLPSDFQKEMGVSTLVATNDRPPMDGGDKGAVPSGKGAPSKTMEV